MKTCTQEEFNAVLLNAPDSNIKRISNNDHHCQTVVWHKNDCVMKLHEKMEGTTSFYRLNQGFNYA